MISGKMPFSANRSSMESPLSSGLMSYPKFHLGAKVTYRSPGLHGLKILPCMFSGVSLVCKATKFNERGSSKMEPHVKSIAEIPEGYGSKGDKCISGIAISSSENRELHPVKSIDQGEISRKSRRIKQIGCVA
jgi:hypothetical protein